jgi:hypothetical protein
VFECDEIVEGTRLRTRYAWTRVDEDNVAWEQAFSFDGGKAWKVNWTMTGRRIQGAPNAWSELAATTA